MAKKKAKKQEKRIVKAAARVKPKPKLPAKPAKKPASAPRVRRSSWLDEKAQMPVIEQYARQLGSFIDATADGVIEDSELQTQEALLVQLMKEIEPKLDDGLHAKVTRLLCELTAYDIMQLLHAMQKNRPQSVFRG